MDTDPGESGRLRLTRASTGPRTRPRFKKLLDQAEAECDQHFSPTGKLKHGKNSPMAPRLPSRSQDYRRRGPRILSEQLRATEEVEGRLKVLRDTVGNLAERRHEADERLTKVRGLAAAQHRLDEAREALRRMEERTRVEAKERRWRRSLPRPTPESLRSQRRAPPRRRRVRRVRRGEGDPAPRRRARRPRASGRSEGRRARAVSRRDRSPARRPRSSPEGRRACSQLRRERDEAGSAEHGDRGKGGPLFASG